MANRIIEKVTLDKDRLRQALTLRHSSLKALGAAPDIGRTEKTLGRCVAAGEIPPDLLEKIAKHLDVDPDFLSGKFDRAIEEQYGSGQDAGSLQRIDEAKKKLDPAQYPYVSSKKKTAQREYLNYILLAHDIDPDELLKMTVDQRTDFRTTVDEALEHILRQFFSGSNQ